MTAIATRHLSDSTDSLLRFALRADATLTGLGGLVAAAAANPLSSLTGLTPVQLYGASAFLIGYGLVVFALAALPDLRRAGVGVVIANVAFTLATAAIVVDDVVPLTGAGVVATLASGGYTAFFAALQYLGVRRLV